MRGDVPVDSEASVVTSSISRLDPPAQSLGGAHRGRMCVCAFIGVSVCACMRAPVLYCVSQDFFLHFYVSKNQEKNPRCR